MTAPPDPDDDGSGIRFDRRALIGAGAAGLAAFLAGCGDDSEPNSTAEPSSAHSTGGSPGEVIVVGAGAAGITAATLLHRAGVDVRVIEARDEAGGRMRHDLTFTDFPIPLGAEWLHESPDELGLIADDPGAVDATELAAYRADDPIAFHDVETGLELSTMGGDVDPDLKFVGTSWLGFFEQYLLPDLDGRITFGVEIVRVDDTGDRVVLTDTSGRTHVTDAVVVTVPLALLQQGRIEFVPPLPDAHREAIERAEVWAGMKVFVEFAEAFYPVFTTFADSFTPDGQRLYYDAAYGQRSGSNVLGLFAVGRQAERYQALDPGEELRDVILAELDEVFDGAASSAYVRHLAQNWNDEPFARGAYLADEADWRIPPQLQERFSDRVLLAGDAYTSHDDWSAVDDAARSARDAVRDLLG